MIKKEIKICLPSYKIAYSFVFILLLSLVRGIFYMEEIGGVLEEAMAVLAMIFCADTYLMEVQSKRFDIFQLYCLKKRVIVIGRRIVVQVLYLIILAMIGYGLFYWQKPIRLVQGDSLQFDILFLFYNFIVAVIITILFFSLFSIVSCNLFRNLWAGIGITFLVWFFFVSKKADEIFGTWNLFSYSFRDIMQPYNMNWLYGKMIMLILSLLLMIAIPIILKKRG